MRAETGTVSGDVPAGKQLDDYRYPLSSKPMSSAVLRRAEVPEWIFSSIIWSKVMDPVTASRRSITIWRLQSVDIIAFQHHAGLDTSDLKEHFFCFPINAL